MLNEDQSNTGELQEEQLSVSTNNPPHTTDEITSAGPDNNNNLSPAAAATATASATTTATATASAMPGSTWYPGKFIGLRSKAQMQSDAIRIANEQPHLTSDAGDASRSLQTDTNNSSKIF